MGNKGVQRRLNIDGTPFLGKAKQYTKYLTHFFEKELEGTDHEKLEYLKEVERNHVEVQQVMEAQDISLPGDSDSIVSNFFEKLEEPQAEAYYDVIRALKLQE